MTSGEQAKRADALQQNPGPARRLADVVAKVYDVVRTRAINYEFRPGERINELELAAELGVSRTPIRESLNRLISEGMIAFVPNRGFFRLPLDIAEVSNLYEVRRVLEVGAARLACARASDDDISALAADWSAALADIVDVSTIERARRDETFHERLVGLSGNDEFVRALVRINACIRFVRSVALENPRYGSPLGAGPGVGDHDVLLEALRARDSDRCASILEQHIAMSLDDAMVLIKEGLGRIYLTNGSGRAPPLR